MSNPPIADFDSASAMLRATARALRGKDFPRLGMTPALEPLARVLGGAVNLLPRGLREQVYIVSGALEAPSAKRLAEVRAEDLARWAVRQYPQRAYPAVAIGSSNGAAVHLWSALGIPWLPQTVLLPVRSRPPVDDPPADMEAHRDEALRLLEANPELALHHMHDANQDRLMLHRMTYFRVKRRSLGATYQDFLDRTLVTGGTIFLVECRMTWPVTRVDERYFFQSGAVGGLTPDEYLHGSARVADYLRRYGSPVRRWSAPPVTSEAPEAEWGFDSALHEDVARLARARGYRLRRIIFDDPMDLSPLVADLYRWWYARRGVVSRRLLVDSFVLMDPLLTLRTGSVPYWMTFNVEPDARRLEAYLNAEPPFDEIALMLFSHGVDSAGLAPISRWQALLSRAARCGWLAGVDPRRYPRDFATFVRYHVALARIAERIPPLSPMDLAELDDFLAEHAHQYAVRWIEDSREAWAGLAGSAAG